jgi:hypothetical protein
LSQKWDYTNIEDRCNEHDSISPFQSPINIASPFIYQGMITSIIIKEPCIKFKYKPMKGSISLFNLDGNNLKIVGDFGHFVFKDEPVFKATDITFFAHSEHTVSIIKHQGLVWSRSQEISIRNANSTSR